MNQSLLLAEILLRNQEWERKRHVEEGRILRALDGANPDQGRARQAMPTGNVAAPSTAWGRVRQFWQGLWVGAPEARRPLCTDSPV